ncbi:MAG TPA: hypothetical protein PK079_09180 [Leptospiraceae bacterium]|nr:hypothetical protein [Leptospiraceae bacterium]HMW06843.1 hypothetical protein [Leptospiraceae bacterium]HMX32255.1 hypothetical protein [Leptospiraceae bacterium]HMY32362.1 hypothetical protein [Leptospiraceae bacterium]HMZ66994.1 hypothetical protein [Leptospiraceae bacterium]
MKFFLFLILFFSHCIVIQKTSPLQNFPKAGSIAQNQNSVFIISNHEVYKNGIKVKSEATHYHLVDSVRNSGIFSKIETDIEKADQIIEIEIQTHREDNAYLPFITTLTLSLVPYFQRIEMKENFRLVKKNGDVLYEANRSQKFNYWFGFFFFINGIIQLTEEPINNHPGFELKLAEDINQNIVDEMAIKNLLPKRETK